MHEAKLQIKIVNDKFMKPADKATLLFNIEQWMNDEVATEAYKKFKVGFRTHITMKDVR